MATFGDDPFTPPYGISVVVVGVEMIEHVSSGMVDATLILEERSEVFCAASDLDSGRGTVVGKVEVDMSFEIREDYRTAVYGGWGSVNDERRRVVVGEPWIVKEQDDVGQQWLENKIGKTASKADNYI